MEKYILSEKEYNALDKAFTNAGWEDDGQFIYQYKGCDYYGCYDEDYLDGYDYKKIKEDGDTIYIVPLSEYMGEIDDALIDFVDCYDFNDEDIEAYDGLCKRFGCYTESCRER